MRINVYAEEITNRVEIIEKKTKDGKFTGLRIYLELPVTHKGENISGPFMHHPGDDDSSAVTFWGKKHMIPLLEKALKMLKQHYTGR